MNTQKLIKGFAALVLVSLPVAGFGCVGQTGSESEESIGTAEQAITVCPGPALVTTGSPANFDDECGPTASARRDQYGADVDAPSDLGAQCQAYCGQSLAACGTDWRLDSALGNPDVALYFPGALDTVTLNAPLRRPGLGQSASETQEVTCLDRRDVNVNGDDQHQWAAICTCPDVP